MQSRFRLFPYLLVVFLTIITGLLVYKLLTIFVIKGIFPLVGMLMFVLFGLILFCMIWIELRKVMTRITIDDEYIIVKYWGGFGKSMSFEYSVLDGYKTTTLPSRYENYEYMYLIKDKNTIIVLSAFYHKNYKDLHYVLDKKIKRICHERFRIIPYFKHMLS